MGFRAWGLGFGFLGQGSSTGSDHIPSVSGGGVTRVSPPLAVPGVVVVAFLCYASGCFPTDAQLQQAQKNLSYTTHHYTCNQMFITYGTCNILQLPRNLFRYFLDSILAKKTGPATKTQYSGQPRISESPSLSICSWVRQAHRQLAVAKF